jgi:hypothetical protein
MKTDLETLKNTLDIGYTAYEDSRNEAEEIWDLFHNRHYTDYQLGVLEERGQPKETFNVVKLFARMLLGYYSTVVNIINVDPVQVSDMTTASVLDDLIVHTFKDNNFDAEGDKIKLDGLISGILAAHVEVEDTKAKDQFGRPIRRVELSHCPALELILDPMSIKEDYSDARFLHRFKWVSEDHIIQEFGKDKLSELEAYHNHLDVDSADFEHNFIARFNGKYKVMDNYLLVETIIVDDDGDRWNIFWCGDTELKRLKITHKEVKFSYRVHKVHTSNRTEHYGIFREMVETQKAINQALIKIQLMVNTQKVFAEKDALVDGIDNFTTAFNRVNAVIQVKKLSGIRVENLTREVLDQYTIIDKAFDRIQRILGINDSFLGMAYASDSGRKVKLQQNATIMSLRYVTGRIEQFYRLLGWDTVNLIKQYYTATQVVRIADDMTGQRWVAVNQPLMRHTGQFNLNTGEPIMQPVMEIAIDPASGEELKDEQGNIIVVPVPTADTDIAFTNVDVTITATSYNDEDEKNQLMMESVLQGPAGSMLSQVNPAGYFKIVALSVKSLKARYSQDIAGIMEQTAAMIAGTPMEQAIQQNYVSGNGQGQVAGGEAPMSSTLKLPQNTNEGM